MAARLTALAAQIKALNADVADHKKVLALWQQLDFYTNFAELDWQPLVGAIDQIQRALDALSAAMQESDNLLHQATRDHAIQDTKLAQTRQACDDCAILADATPAEARGAYFPALAALQGDASLAIESCNKREIELREEIQGMERLDGARTNRRATAWSYSSA